MLVAGGPRGVVVPRVIPFCCKFGGGIFGRFRFWAERTIFVFVGASAPISIGKYPTYLVPQICC